MKRISYFFIFFFMLAPFSYAGGPLVVDDGEAIKWDVSSSSPIVLQVEAGGCTNANGDVILTHDEAMDLLDSAVQAWEDAVPGVIKFTITDSASIPDVNSTNYTDYFSDNTGEAPANDGINPVVFDSDGEIFNDIFGPGADTSTLGFAGPTRYSSDGSRIEEGQAFFNCACAVEDSLFEVCRDVPGVSSATTAQLNAVFEACSFDNSVPNCATNPRTCSCSNGSSSGNCYALCVVDQCPCLGAPTSPTGIETVMRHEIGHMLNLGHSDVGDELADSCETDVDGDCDELTIMYPINEDPADMLTLTHDDEVAIQSIYDPSTLEETTFTITGILEDINGNPLRCAAVTATTDDPADTVMFVSGALADAQDVQGDFIMISETQCQSVPDGYTDDVGECLSGCGDFTLRGLDPAKTYTIAIHPIDPSFIEGKGIGPCSSPEPDPNCIFDGDEGGQPEGIVDETIIEDVSGSTNETVEINNGQPIKLLRSSGGTTPGHTSTAPSCSFNLL